jgi:hypothetical protein
MLYATNVRRSDCWCSAITVHHGQFTASLQLTHTTICHTPYTILHCIALQQQSVSVLPMRCHASDAPAPESRRPSVDYNIPVSPYLQSPKLTHREGRILNSSITATSNNSSSSNNSSHSSLNGSRRADAEAFSTSAHRSTDSKAALSSCSSSSDATSGLQVTTAAAASDGNGLPPKTPPTQPAKVLSRKGAEERMALLSLADSGIVSKRGLLCRGLTSSCGSSSKLAHAGADS